MLYRKLRMIYCRSYVWLFPLKCYDNNDTLPIYNWRKYRETKDPCHLFNVYRKASSHEMILLEEMWEKRYEEYIELFGFSERFLEAHRKEVEIGLIRCNGIENEDNTFYTFEDIAIQELKALQPKDGDVENFNDTLAAVDNIMGIQVNEFTTSVNRFFGYIKMIESRNTKEAA